MPELLNDIWGVFKFLGAWIAPMMVLCLLMAMFWRDILKHLRGPAFAIRPIRGQTLGMDVSAEVAIARIAVKNLSAKPHLKCSVRMLAAYTLHLGYLLEDRCWHPSINPERGESFLLRWAKSEPATADGKYLDLPNDGAERIAECLIIDATDPHGPSCNFCAANPQDLAGRLQGIGIGHWWKLIIRVSSEDGASTDVELSAACADRDPGPITLDYWHPRGESILESQKAELAKTETTTS